jgi:hypothetical protein
VEGGSTGGEASVVAVDAGVGGTYDDSGLVTKPPPSMVSLMVRLLKV